MTNASATSEPCAPSWLERATLAYIFVPCLIFLLGWLSPLFSLPLCVVLIVALLRYIKFNGIPASAPATPPPELETPTPATRMELPRCLVIAAVAFGVVLVSGIGGFGRQSDPDFMKHNSFLRDLVEQPWPVWYSETGPENAPGFLVTYMAVYLPAALTGKVFGWGVANWSLVFWVALGLFLAIQWFLHFVGRKSIVFALLFMLFGGLDTLGWLLLYGLPKAMEIMNDRIYLDWWSLYVSRDPSAVSLMNEVFLLYPSNMTFLITGFHHLFPGWLIIFMVLEQSFRRRSAGMLGLLWAAAPTGSAFVALGLAPFVVLAAWQSRFRNAFGFANCVAAPALLLISALFFMSNNGRYAHGCLWQFYDLMPVVPYLAAVWLLEFGLYAMVIPGSFNDPRLRDWWPWWVLALSSLVLVSFYRLGDFCDFPTKVFIPALMVLQVILGVALARARFGWRKRTARWLVLLLVIGSFGAARSVIKQSMYGISATPIPIESTVHVNEMEPRGLAAQLFSNGDSFFWRVLAREPNRSYTQSASGPKLED